MLRQGHLSGQLTARCTRNHLPSGIARPSRVITSCASGCNTPRTESARWRRFCHTIVTLSPHLRNKRPIAWIRNYTNYYHEETNRQNSSALNRSCYYRLRAHSDDGPDADQRRRGDLSEPDLPEMVRRIRKGGHIGPLQLPVHRFGRRPETNPRRNGRFRRLRW